MATRELYWNIGDLGHYLIYPLFLIAFAIAVYGFYQRYKLWKLGRPEKRWKDIGQGIKDVIVYGIGHKRILKDIYPGWMHFFILLGFIFLVFATAIVFIQADFGIPLFKGGLFLFIKLTANFFGLLALIGVIMAAWRRYIVKPDRLDNKPEDAIAIGLIFIILVTGFLTEGVRMAIQPSPWDIWGFAGYWLALLMQNMSENSLITFHRALWWIHMGLAMFMIGYFPYSKLFHVFLGPINQFFRYRGPVGVPEAIDFEDESIESYGKSQLRDFSWKTLFNTDVCIRCGRCQDNCPAYLSGKNLSPKRIIQDMKGLMEETGAAYKEYKKTKAADQNSNPEEKNAAEENFEWTGRELIGEVIPEADLWACTTCRSCEQQCPVFIEHVDKTIELRRYLVLMESRFPSEAQLAFRNMENNGNPWGIAWNDRAQHLTGLGVKTIQENPEADILYWPGCSGAFDGRNQKVSAAFVKLLAKAGVNFAILGNEEKCCGDSARKLGNEYLYVSLATENIEVMKNYGVKKIVTQCPHCFNTLKHEYPQLGGEFEVIHHTDYLLELINSGKLKPPALNGKTVTYHDSCYLGRYNQIYDSPRSLLKAAGLEIKEMRHHGEKSFCCGAGGGRMWLEEDEGDRINVLRADEAIAVKPDLVATACPFCLTMFDDGIAFREAEDKLKAQDIAEILEKEING